MRVLRKFLQQKIRGGGNGFSTRIAAGLCDIFQTVDLPNAALLEPADNVADLRIGADFFYPRLNRALLNFLKSGVSCDNKFGRGGEDLAKNNIALKLGGKVIRAVFRGINILGEDCHQRLIDSLGRPIFNNGIGFRAVTVGVTALALFSRQFGMRQGVIPSVQNFIGERRPQQVNRHAPRRVLRGEVFGFVLRGGELIRFVNDNGEDAEFVRKFFQFGLNLIETQLDGICVGGASGNVNATE